MIFTRSAVIVNKSSLEKFGLKIKRSLECSNESAATTYPQMFKCMWMILLVFLSLITSFVSSCLSNK